MRKGSGGRVAEEGSSLGLEPTESLPGPNYELQLETVQSNHIKNSPTPYFSINSINFSSSFEFHRPFFKLKCNLLRYRSRHWACPFLRTPPYVIPAPCLTQIHRQTLCKAFKFLKVAGFLEKQAFRIALF